MLSVTRTKTTRGGAGDDDGDFLWNNFARQRNRERILFNIRVSGNNKPDYLQFCNDVSPASLPGNKRKRQSIFFLSVLSRTYPTHRTFICLWMIGDRKEIIKQR